MLVKRWLGNPECREPASSDRLPVHRSESPTGYSSAVCSPAEPASASPVTENTSSIPIRRGNQMRCSSRRRPALGCGARARRIRRQPECHLYFARPVSFLSCADIKPSFLRRAHLLHVEQRPMAVNLLLSDPSQIEEGN